MRPVTYKLTKGNLRPLMTTIWHNLGVWLDGNPALDITIRPHNSKRSNEQNKRMWKIYQTLQSSIWINGKQYDQELWHEQCKRMFIGCNELPNGTLVGISTTTLSTEEMTEYQNKIQAWAAAEYGVIWEF